MAIVVQAPCDNRYVGDEYRMHPKVFLAGCANTDWRKEFVQYFKQTPCVFYDPKRDHWDIHDPKFADEQIRWEYKNLREADIIVYWFNAGSVCPITLLEYGMWGLAKGTIIVVGVTDDYEKRNDIYIQTKLARPDIGIVNNLEALSFELKDAIMKWADTEIKDLVT